MVGVPGKDDLRPTAQEGGEHSDHRREKEGKAWGNVIARYTRWFEENQCEKVQGYCPG